VRRRSDGPSSARCAADVAYRVWIAPVNATLGAVTPDTLPPDWTNLRDRWEYTHAARALLQVIALGALVGSILVDTAPVPSRAPETAQQYRAKTHGAVPPRART